MDRNGIVEALGRQRRVEGFVQHYARGVPAADQQDLAQIVYLALLRMDEDKLRDLWETGDIDFYLRRVIRTQLYGKRTDFDRDCRRFGRRTVNIDDTHGI